MFWIPIVFTILAALAFVCVAALAMSMRAVSPLPLPDISGVNREAEAIYPGPVSRLVE